MQRLIDFPADAFFFDFDGTLGDTSGGIKAGWRKTLEELGISCPDFESIFRVGPPPETMIKSLLPDAPAELQLRCVNTYKRIYDNSAMDGEKPYPWSRDILQKLKEREKKSKSAKCLRCIL